VKGSRIVITINSIDQQWMIILAYINAIGQSIPNLYIFTKGRKRQNYILKCEPNAKMEFQEKRRIIEEILCEWLDHFRDSVSGGVFLDMKHLLLVDGHSTNITYNVCKTGTYYGTHYDIGLPRHTSHRMQPLDVSIFKLFKSYFNSIKERFINVNLAWKKIS
jgi:hypothetical protein